MSPGEALILRVHVPGAESYEIGDEIWQHSLAEAIEAEAQTIAEDAGADELEDSTDASRNELREQVIADMTAALVQAGDTYRRTFLGHLLHHLEPHCPQELRVVMSAPDGVRYSLTRSPVA